MAFISSVLTAPGTTAVQIAEQVGSRERIMDHASTAPTEAELGKLLQRAREPLENPARGSEYSVSSPHPSAGPG